MKTPQEKAKATRRLNKLKYIEQTHQEIQIKYKRQEAKQKLKEKNHGTT